MNTRELRAARREKLMRRFADGAVSEPILATGNHLAAQNDEPEPTFTEEQLIAGDLARNQLKGERDELRALHRQIDANRRNPLLRGVY